MLQLLIRGKRTDHRYAQAISHSTVDGRPEKNLRVIANMPTEFLHQNFDFGQRHPRSAGHLDKHVRGVGQHAASIHQRILQRLSERVVRAIVRIGFAETEQASPVWLRNAASKSSKPIRISPGR